MHWTRVRRLGLLQNNSHLVDFPPIVLTRTVNKIEMFFGTQIVTLKRVKTYQSHTCSDFSHYAWQETGLKCQMSKHKEQAIYNKYNIGLQGWLPRGPRNNIFAPIIHKLKSVICKTEECGVRADRPEECVDWTQSSTANVWCCAIQISFQNQRTFSPLKGIQLGLLLAP